MPNNRPVLFIYTNSFDLSADVLIRRLGNAAVFRFNLDLWRDYQIEINGQRVTIANPSGRMVDSRDIVKFLWRKPLTNHELYPDQSFSRERVFEEDELAYAMREVWNAMYYSGRAVLIDPLSDILTGKLLQAQIAEQYFPVPQWAVVSGKAQQRDAELGRVAKSLTSRRIADRSVLFTRRVNVGELSPTSPWFVQSYVRAQHDVTVVFVRGALFAFALDRTQLPTGVVDWRRARVLAPEQNWVPHTLPGEISEAIQRFMTDMSLHYGRLDFLLSDRRYYFLEVNPNGEWGWLDPDGKTGIVDALAAELSPETPCRGLPNPRVVRGGNGVSW